MRLSRILLILFFVSATYSQSKVPVCNLGLTSAPVLRGFYLGQSYKDIAKRIRGFETEYFSTDRGYYGNPELDFRILHLTSLSSYDSLNDEEDFKDVTITWQFANSNLARLFVTYTEFRPASLRDFINQFAKTTGVPSASFRVTDKHKAKLTCKDFSFELYQGQYSQIGWSPDWSSVILEDTKAIARLEAQAAAYKRSIKLEATRRKEEERKRRSTLRP
ncbi:MAG: hypothetical protein DMF63_13580 [Acidobacteria bacterium]|nr:MAG: hypothetical protein DMF63_13580 [Acidobacteriota bacterium]